jgi:DNA-binding MarR family transcriptional regulator
MKVNEARHEGRDWTLMSSHGFVFVYIAAYPESTIRAIAGAVEITERQVARIIRDLSQADLIKTKRVGRRNVYTIRTEARFRHPLLAHVNLERLVQTLTPEISREADSEL